MDKRNSTKKTLPAAKVEDLAGVLELLNGVNKFEASDLTESKAAERRCSGLIESEAL